ncbi:uncharacterized protein SOCE26_004370 [Sorangium cellulosum]|uniref:Uncharacterized protein n=1 Tax=Sorangium cellulosum TaxID=56 RepID=A0A2L0EIC7_SORCE|nr:hypothetical protein [Sorangium cellulosum]AUX39055.1 uncharacterized protein SOCE26_004370 [Sorangium cellulosum]
MAARKGDHVFNNVVAKLTKAFDAGLRAYFSEATRKIDPADRASLSRGAPAVRQQWMARHMPRTLTALSGFKESPELVGIREGLQTVTFEGGDVNGPAYSGHAQEFEEATLAFFRKLALTGSYLDENTLLPDIAQVRRAFQHMAEAAEDPGALERLLEQHKGDPRELARVQAEIEQVRGSLRWAWARCEQLYRMATNELLRL